jgi:two-component system chemotaxis response regulator CheB
VQGFANWLDGATELEVAVAQHQEQNAPGRALIAPDDVHMTVTADGTTMLDRSPPIKGLRPSATLLFESVARSYGHTAVGVVLTGMGEDGATGLEELHRAGGLVIAQDQESCVVFGMPKAAIDLGVVDHVLLPDEISAMLVQIDQRNISKRAALPAQQGTLAQIE